MQAEVLALRVEEGVMREGTEQFCRLDNAEKWFLSEVPEGKASCWHLDFCSIQQAHDIIHSCYFKPLNLW